jgi:HEAT repeat protein
MSTELTAKEIVELIDGLKDRISMTFRRDQARLMEFTNPKHEDPEKAAAQQKANLEKLASQLNGEPGLVSRLESILGDRKAEQSRRTWAAALLRLLPDKADILLEMIDPKNEEDSDLRAWLAYYLGEMQCDKAVEPLAKRLQEDHSLTVRIWTACALGRLGERGRLGGKEPLGDVAVDALGFALEFDNYDVKEEAARALGRIGGDGVIEPLMDHLVVTSETRAEVRVMAAKGLVLAFSNDNRPAKAASLERVKQSLPAALADSKPEVRAAAVEVVKSVFGNKAMEFLLTVIRNAAVADVRASAARALVGIGEEEAVTKLQEDLFLGEPTQADRAAEALKAMGIPRAAAVLARKQEIFKDFFKQTVQVNGQDAKETMKKALGSADRGFDSSIWMHRFIFGVGIALIITSVVIFFLGDRVDGAQWFGTGGVIVGLGTILTNFYKGPVQAIKKDVGDLAQLNAAFLGYADRLALIGMEAVHEYTTSEPKENVLDKISREVREATAQTMLLVELYVEDNETIKTMLKNLSDKSDLTAIFAKMDLDRGTGTTVVK